VEETQDIQSCREIGWLTDHFGGVRLRLRTAATVHSPGDMRMGNHGGMIWTGDNSLFVHQSADNPTSTAI
jgi:hypothetical protein